MPWKPLFCPLRKARYQHHQQMPFWETPFKSSTIKMTASSSLSCLAAALSRFFTGLGGRSRAIEVAGGNSHQPGMSGT